MARRRAVQRDNPSPTLTDASPTSSASGLSIAASTSPGGAGFRVGASFRKLRGGHPIVRIGRRIVSVSPPRSRIDEPTRLVPTSLGLSEREIIHPVLHPSPTYW